MKYILIFFGLFNKSSCFLNMTFCNNTSDVSAGLAETINGLNPSQLAIFIDYTYNFTEIDEFLNLIHKRHYKSVIFYDVEQYFQFIETSIRSSIETSSLIFGKPFDFVKTVNKRRIAHRLNLFIFYWGAKRIPKDSEIQFKEPMRAVVITRPRKKAFRIYYSQDTPTESGTLKLVNWFDAESLGLYHTPLLPSSTKVYSNLFGRVLRVPVFHSPPWFWVNYENDTDVLSSDDWLYDTDLSLETFADYKEVNVTGGRDHRLLTLLATSMNFNFVYIDTPGRTQGSLRIDDERNTSFTGGIGLLQERKAHLLLGDLSLSWERRKAVEFSFFTLSDSGAFVTHAPRQLNEALAVLRPFKKDVWPFLILTLVLSGPILYMVIAIPYKFKFKANKFFYTEYLNEITPINPAVRVNRQFLNQDEQKMPKNLLDRCVWFTVQLFLKQSCSEPYNGCRAKFLMIVFWISATYVLADVYSAQLTSQFARPAREQPINNLQKLQRAILREGYRLYVEKDSSSLEMLQNGTEIFQNLYALMKQQTDYEGYLIDSVESGIKLIADGLENKVVMGGRETLYFNMKQFGIIDSQPYYRIRLEKNSYRTIFSYYGIRIVKTILLRTAGIFPRFEENSAPIGYDDRVEYHFVSFGAYILISLNDSKLIRLFEGGILDKMTNAEYEALSRSVDVNALMNKSDQQNDVNNKADAIDSNKENKKFKNQNSDKIIQPINLRMLQGAFIALVFGWGLAGAIFLFEIVFGRQYFYIQGWRGKSELIIKNWWKLHFVNLLGLLYIQRN